MSRHYPFQPDGIMNYLGYGAIPDSPEESGGLAVRQGFRQVFVSMLQVTA